MLKRVLVTSLGLFASVMTASASADDLMQVYEQALHNDATFKQAQSTWWSAKQDLPIAVSAYLPQISVTDTYQRQWNRNKPAGGSDGWRTQNALTLSASQAIFDFSAWTNIHEQAASVKSATATYLAAVEDLMQRTVTAYFNVLEAYDVLRFTIANKKSVKRQLVTAQQKFRVGLIAITGVYDAQSRYDQSVADEITDRNSLFDQLENLRAITGQHYISLQGVVEQVPLIRPQPNNINDWVSIAERQNYTIKSNQYAAQSAHENILNQAAGYLPTVDATGSYGITNNGHYAGGSATESKKTRAGSFGLSLDWNPIKGGQNYFSTKQARYDYLTAVGALEQSHRDVVNQTRQAFLGIRSGISRIQADKQSIISAENELKATQAGYEVGTRTMVDVLNSLTQVYQNKSTYMQDQYSYIDEIISLKEQAGTLSVKDLMQINSWLKKRVEFPLPATDYRNGHKGLHPETAAQLSQLNSQRHQLGSSASEQQHTKQKMHSHSAAHTKQVMTSSSYLVQLFSAKSKSAADRFVRMQPASLQKQMNVVQHGLYYRVLMGEYPSRAAADKAVHLLPERLSKHVWIFKSHA